MARPMVPLPGFVEEALAHCYGCGPANPQGLHLQPKQEGDLTVVEGQPSKVHAGWDTVIHGGVLAAFLDEAAAFTAFQSFLGFAMTRNLNVTYLRRVHWTKPVRAEGRVKHRDEERIVVEVQVLQDGKLCTECLAEFRILAAPPQAGG